MTIHDRDKIIAAAKEAGFQVIFDGKFGRDDYFSSMASIPSVERFYAIAFEDGRVSEREACAVVCERLISGDGICADNEVWIHDCAEAIRARGDMK